MTDFPTPELRQCVKGFTSRQTNQRGSVALPWQPRGMVRKKRFPTPGRDATGGGLALSLWGLERVIEGGENPPTPFWNIAAGEMQTC